MPNFLGALTDPRGGGSIYTARYGTSMYSRIRIFVNVRDPILALARVFTQRILANITNTREYPNIRIRKYSHAKRVRILANTQYSRVSDMYLCLYLL